MHTVAESSTVGRTTTANVLRAIPERTRRRRYLPALAMFGIDYLGVFLGTAGACLAPTWIGRMIFAVVAAFSIGGLFIIGHDAAHSSFVPSRRGNRILARLAFLPAYVPLASWRYNHNVRHHRFLRVRGEDVVWQPWSYEEYWAAPRWQRAYYRLLRTPLGLPFYWTVHNWLPRFLLADRSRLRSEWKQFQVDRACVAAYAFFVFGAMFALGRAVEHAAWSWPRPSSAVETLIWALVVPYLMWSFLIGFVDFVQHTHPRSVWFGSIEEWDYVTANLRSSTHIVLPLHLNGLWHHILEHAAHHVDPRVPLYELSRAQEALETAYPDDVLVERLTPAFLWRLWKTCRLYDFTNRQWLNYDGTPTAPSQRSAPRFSGCAVTMP